MSQKLFENDSESDTDDFQLTTNKDYAKSYNLFRSKELIKKLKDKEQNESDSESGSDTDSSDDNEVAANVKFDQAFFKTLSSLKSKDPSVYDANVKFFENINILDKLSPESASKSSKPMTVKDYERKILLEKGGIYEDNGEDETAKNRPQSPTYVEQQRHLKNEFKNVINDDSEEEGGHNWGGIFQKRVKTKEEQAVDEADYAKWLAGEKAIIGDTSKKLQSLKDYWSNPKLSKDEVFLRDYILNNGYSNKNEFEVPSYDDIVGRGDDVELSDDEAELEKQAEFEQKFNFRFEEPDQEFIKRYPRTIENSVRKTDNRRKEKRIELKERKTKEKEQKMRELEMLNALRKKEIEEKIMKLKQVAGAEDMPFNDADLDEDFDPDEHDRKMQKIFNNEYYQIDEGEEKPTCPEDIEDLKVEDWDNYDPKKDKEIDAIDEPHCEDTEFNMDCDYDETKSTKKSLEEEMIENTRDKRKRRKRRSKFAEVLKKEKPVFNPDDEKTYGQYLDEYYKLDYEDIIGDIPCRFKYVETVPNDFGLSIEEILMAKNKELNQWASLKKATQIRPEHVEKNEVKMFQMKARNQYLKKKMLPSLFEEETEENDNENPIKFEKLNSKISDKSSKDKKKQGNKNELFPNKSKKLATEISEIMPAQEKESDNEKFEKTNSESNKNSKKIKQNKNSKESSFTEPKDSGKNNLEATSSSLPIQKDKSFPKINNKVDGNVQKNKKMKLKPTENKKLANKTIPLLKRSHSNSTQNEKEAKNDFAILNSSSENNTNFVNQKKKQKVELLAIKSFAKKPGQMGKHNKTANKIQEKKISQNSLSSNKSKKKNINQPRFSASSLKTNSNKISDERLRAFGINPKKYHKKIKYSNAKNSSISTAMSAGKNQKQQNSQMKKHKMKLKQFLGKTT